MPPSAQPIKRTRASVVCVDAGRLLAVRLEDPAAGRTGLYLPGGGVEPGETPAAAAHREALEETGYDVAVDEASCGTLRYPFVWGGQTYACLTHFYAARLAAPSTAPQAVHDASFHRGVEWVRLADVRHRFGYHQGILAQILARLPRTGGRE